MAYLYPMTASETQELAGGLEEYYQESWEKGIKNLADRMARSQMGIGSKYIDMGKDGWATLKKKSVDSFKVTFKARLKEKVAIYAPNKFELASALVTLGEKAVDQLLEMIPIKVLPSVLSAITSAGADKLGEVIHDAEIADIDSRLAAKSEQELTKLFTTDKGAVEFIQNAVKQYKLIGEYLKMLPGNITTFDDAITYPRSAFRVLEATSSLKVSIWSVIGYLESMTERLEACQIVANECVKDVRTKMPQVVENVVQRAYAKGVEKGLQDKRGGKYAAGKEPALAPKTGGGATQLADRVAHAVAKGYFDVSLQR